MKLHATGRDLIIKESERLISGSVNIYTCEFTFDSSWDGYTVTAVFSTNGSRLVNMAVVDGKCDVPVEVLRPNARIRIGIFGTDGTRSRPTTYSEWITVEQGADVSGSKAQPPTPSVYEQWMTALDEKHDDWNEQEQAREEAEAARVEAENARAEAEQAREDLETGYVAQAKASAEESKAAQAAAETAAENAAENAVSEAEAKLEDYVSAAEAAQAAAEKARDEAGEIVGGDFATTSEAKGYADAAEANANKYTDEAEANANKYTDQKISEIPTPDVSGQIGSHNEDEEAHADIRQAVSDAASTAESNANKYTDGKIAAIPTPDVSGQIASHNSSANAHSDIRAAVATAKSTADSKAPMYTYGTTDLTAGSSALETGKLHFVYE